MATDGRMLIACRAALEIRDGTVVNLGVGIPTLVADVIGHARTVFFHSENGVLGFGPPPPAGEEDDDLVDAGKRPITEIPGTAYFHSTDSFAMIRGGHIDCAIMGALQVDAQGTVANWTVPGGSQLGAGGAMDLLAGARRVIVTMTLTTADGRPKVVRRCTLPVSGLRRADLLVTDLAVFDFPQGQARLIEVAPGVGVEDVRAKVEAEFAVAAGLRPMLAE